jgi:hypothetical protein
LVGIRNRPLFLLNPEFRMSVSFANPRENTHDRDIKAGINILLLAQLLSPSLRMLPYIESSFPNQSSRSAATDSESTLRRAALPVRHFGTWEHLHTVSGAIEE